VSKGKKTLLIVLVVVVIILISGYNFFKGNYNTFVILEEGVAGAWADVENNLQRRFDLIPNLVSTVKGFANQEKDVFLGVTEARAKVGGAGNVNDRMNAENELSGALSRLLLVVENYPQIKSDANFRALQDELSGTENRLAVSRKRYNDSVRVYNTRIRVFPANIFAGLYGFEKKEFFEAPEESKTAPTVNFDD